MESDAHATGVPAEKRVRWTIALIGLLIIAAVLRFHGLGAHSFWTDEFYSLDVTSGRPWAHQQFPANADAPLPLPRNYIAPEFDPIHIWTGQVHDAHPPAYSIVVNAFRVVVGTSGFTSEFVGRAPSAIFSLLLLWAIYRAVEVSATKSAALWTVAILAVSAIQISYAQEMRSYTMISAIVFAIVWFVLRAEKADAWSRGQLIGLSALVYLALLTHYLCVGPLMIVGVYGVAVLRGSTRRHFIYAGLIAAALFALTWGPFLAAQYRNGMGSMMRWMATDPHQTVLDEVKRLLQWPWTALAFDSGTPFRVRYVGAILLLGPLVVAWWHKPARIWVLLTWGVLGSVALSDVSEHSNRLGVWRYTLLAGPAFAAALVVASERLRTVHRFAPALVPALVLGWCVYRLPSAYMARNADIRPMVALTTADAPAGDQVIVLCGPPRKSWQAKCHLLTFCTYDKRTTPPRFAILTEPATPRLLEAIDASPHVFVLATPGSDVNALLPGQHLKHVADYVGIGAAYVKAP